MPELRTAGVRVEVGWDLGILVRGEMWRLRERDVWVRPEVGRAEARGAIVAWFAGEAARSSGLFGVVVFIHFCLSSSSPSSSSSTSSSSSSSPSSSSSSTSSFFLLVFLLYHFNVFRGEV
jgi:hypothetical protein